MTGRYVTSRGEQKKTKRNRIDKIEATSSILIHGLVSMDLFHG
jgi:hypothetical protein